MQGLLGGLAGWAIVAAAVAVLNDSVAEVAGLYGSSFQLQPFGWREVSALLGVSAVLGWTGAYLAVGHFLRHFHMSHH